MTGSTPLLLLSLYNVVAAFFNYVNSRVLDRFGRIPVMTVGLVSHPDSLRLGHKLMMVQIGCIVDLSVYTALVARYSDTDNRVGNGFAILCLFLFAVFYGGCLDASSYVYCSEIFPTSVRAHGIGFSVSGLFLSNICRINLTEVVYH